MILWCLWERSADKLCSEYGIYKVAHQFMYKQCDGTLQEADLTGDLMVDIETFICKELLLYERHSRWGW